MVAALLNKGKRALQPGLMVQILIVAASEIEVDRLQVQGLPGQLCEFKASLSNLVSPCLQILKKVCVCLGGWGVGILAQWWCPFLCVALVLTHSTETKTTATKIGRGDVACPLFLI